jgi:hypothetical protein
MRIAGLYDIDPRRLSGDQLAFAKELADPERIQHAETNVGHAARGVGAVTPLRRKGAKEKKRWMKALRVPPARIELAHAV